MLTGIASPEQMRLDLEPYAESIQPLVFGDHHNFKRNDIERINQAFDELPKPGLIVTTETDATRLKQAGGLSDEVKQHLIVLPIRVSLLLGQEEAFNQNIIGYVRKNSRNSILVKGKDENKPKDGDRAGDRPRTISFRNN